MAEFNDRETRSVIPGMPVRCTECEGQLKYRGLGQYVCTDCGNIEMDDYGKVRYYLEKHPGANQRDVSIATGVPAARIRQLLLDERIEITAASGLFLNCEMCGKAIRSGVRCPECEQKYQNKLEQERRANKAKNPISGHAAIGPKGPGEMRFLK
ncbi:MAG: hypothetical protein K6E63_08065 [Lachnospiraceae bacterium]|nr:hypothetical protein [Lachnospiraceae bacterium]